MHASESAWSRSEFRDFMGLGLRFLTLPLICAVGWRVAPTRGDGGHLKQGAYVDAGNTTNSPLLHALIRPPCGS